MKWSGQHIYDLISRFRNDVYLENISTGTIASGAHLGLDSNNKIVKAVDGGGDLTSIVAGTGLSGTSLTGPIPTLNVDASIPEITTLAGLTAIGTQGNTITTTSYSVFDIDRTPIHSQAAAEDITALHVDFDRAAPEAGTYAHNDIGIDLDVTSASLGTSSLKGMDIDVVGDTRGTSTAYGIHLDVDGADTNIGMVINTAGTHLKLEANADADDYATFTVANTGDLTIATVGDGTTDSDLVLDADGQIRIEPADGKTVNIISAETSASSTGSKLNLISDDGAALGDDHMLGRLGFAAAEDTGSTYRVGAKIEAYADAAWSASENGTRLEFYTMDGNNASELSLTLDSDRLATFAGQIMSKNTTTSSSSGGGGLRLLSDDGAALGDDHRLGYINFQAAEDGSSTLRTGASIAAYADAAWSDTVNDTRLEFYTSDGDNNQELSLTLDSDLLATFAGAVTVTGAITGDLTGQADTVATIAGLAPNTATTQASQPNITGVGTIGTGVWEGTAIATDQQKHLVWFTLKGYGTGDGTNYEVPEVINDTNAPFEHDTSTGSDGLTAQTIQVMMRLGGLVAPRAGTLKKWYGWATTAGSQAANIGLFRVRPTRNDSTNLTPVLLDNVSYTALGNTKMEDFDETSFTDADIAVGDVIYTGIKCQSGKLTFFTSTLEIEWD